MRCAIRFPRPRPADAALAVALGIVCLAIFPRIAQAQQLPKYAIDGPQSAQVLVRFDPAFWTLEQVRVYGS